MRVRDVKQVGKAKLDAPAARKSRAEGEEGLLEGLLEPDSEEDFDYIEMEQQIYEQEQADEAIASEFGCCECGFINKAQTGHHAQIRCPHTGRCGQCGNVWPCAEHKSQAKKRRRS